MYTAVSLLDCWWRLCQHSATHFNVSGLRVGWQVQRWWWQVYRWRRQAHSHRMWLTVFLDTGMYTFIFLFDGWWRLCRCSATHFNVSGLHVGWQVHRWWRQVHRHGAWLTVFPNTGMYTSTCLTVSVYVCVWAWWWHEVVVFNRDAKTHPSWTTPTMDVARLFVPSWLGAMVITHLSIVSMSS